MFFLIYINDLSYNLSSTTKPFADAISLFTVVHDVTQSTNELNDDLEKISYWDDLWKMSYNPDKSKQAHKVIFSCKIQKVNIPVARSSCQKHLDMYLHEKLNFTNRKRKQKNLK